MNDCSLDLTGLPICIFVWPGGYAKCKWLHVVVSIAKIKYPPACFDWADRVDSSPCWSFLETIGENLFGKQGCIAAFAQVQTSNSNLKRIFAVKYEVGQMMLLSNFCASQRIREWNKTSYHYAFWCSWILRHCNVQGPFCFKVNGYSLVLGNTP